MIHFALPCEVTPRAAFALWRDALPKIGNGTKGTFRSIQNFRREPSRGPGDCRAKDRGGYDSIAANLPPHSKAKGSAAQSGRQNGVVSQ